MQEIDASTFHNILYQYIYFVQFSSIPGACMCGASFFPPLGIVFDPYTQQLITEVRDGYVFLTILLTLQPLHPFPEYVCRRQPARMRSSLYIYIYIYPGYHFRMYRRSARNMASRGFTFSSAWPNLPPYKHTSCHCSTTNSMM